MNRAATSQAGFTLVEVLMVVFIIGISASAILMTVPPRQNTLEAEAERLDQTLVLLADRAVLTGALHGLELTDFGYEAVQRQNGAWVTVPAFGRNLPDGVTLRQAEDRAGPYLVFDPSGAPAEGGIELVGQRRSITVIDPVGTR